MAVLRIVLELLTGLRPQLWVIEVPYIYRCQRLGIPGRGLTATLTLALSLSLTLTLKSEVDGSPSVCRLDQEEE